MFSTSHGCKVKSKQLKSELAMQILTGNCMVEQPETESTYSMKKYDMIYDI